MKMKWDGRISGRIQKGYHLVEKLHLHYDRKRAAAIVALVH